ncbi:MAG TPA: SPOR domain-containing protein, partial [Allosphingosinicella sp.]
MTKSKRAGLALLAAGLLSGTGLTAPAAAQYAAQPYRPAPVPYRPAPAPAPYREDAGTALTRHLRTLADQPRSLHALSGAGRAALELGDP